MTATYANQPCSDAFLVILTSSGTPKDNDAQVQAAADKVPDAKYLRTDKSCKTFNQSLNGNPIYAAYVGPFDSMADACQARVDTGSAASYVRLLSLDRTCARSARADEAAASCRC